jgi:transcriptional regulator with XRE-family HTH domain
MNKTTEKLLKHKKAKGLTYDQLAVILGISKVTLLKRVKNHDWSITEDYFINNKL